MSDIKQVKRGFLVVARVFAYLAIFIVAVVFYGLRNAFFSYAHLYILMLAAVVAVVAANGGIACFLDGISCPFKGENVSSDKIKNALKLHLRIRASLYFASVLNLLLGLLAAYTNESFELDGLRFAHTITSVLPPTIIGIFTGTCVISPFINFMKDTEDNAHFGCRQYYKDMTIM